ncbi:hypothetical protein DPMN_107193 [Dreissena polymorpha]|uniref:Uncharacterized protein n=1 Tax=Dreissena polymorpha TaxID=45954 RepID=A0A9D4K6P5_DREPO|nr:hypothetical protein DPMN_107193 [Dreissena polymorpha]
MCYGTLRYNAIRKTTCIFAKCILSLVETDLKLKRKNSSQGHEIPKTQPRGMLAVKDFWEFTQDIKSKRQELIQQFKACDHFIILRNSCFNPPSLKV